MKTIIGWINKFGNEYNGLLTTAGLLVPFLSWIGTRAASNLPWMNSHKVWFVWGGLAVGLVILLVATVFWLKKFFSGEWWAVLRREKIRNLSSKLKVLGELQNVQKLNFKQQTLAKEKVPVCVVDDRNAAVIKRELTQFGYKNIATRKDLPSDEELLKYAILILDVDGVGTKRNSNGLSFAMNFKGLHPLKQIIMVSGYFNDPRYEADVEKAKGVLDGFFTRSTSYDAYMKPMLARCLDTLMDPCAIGRIIQKQLIQERLANDGKVFIKLFEDAFVRGVQSVCKENKGELPYDWISHLFKRKQCSDMLDVVRKYGLTWDAVE